MYVTVHGVRLFFDVLNPELEIAGSGLRHKPALVCIPGGPGGDHQTLRPYFDRFADVAQVIFLDPRGGGRSEHGPETGWNLDQWGDDIAGFLDALGLEKPVVIGSSGGTLMVQSFLARHGDRADGAILVNACSRMIPDELVAGYEAAGGSAAGLAARAIYGRPGPEDYAAFFRHCLPLYSRKGDLSSLGEGAGRTNVNPAASARFFGPGGEGFRFDFRGRLSKVECPVMVIAGTQDPVTPTKWGIEVAEALPEGRAETLVFDDCSHLITVDQPEGFDAAVRRFVEAR
jgi:proline iminopeptidase